MDSSYAPRSPDLSGYIPQSPDLALYRPPSPTFAPAPNNYAPQSPDLSALQSHGPGQATLSAVNKSATGYSLEAQQQQHPRPLSHWNQRQQQQHQRQHYPLQQQQGSYLPTFTSDPQASQPPPQQPQYTTSQPYLDQYSYSQPLSLHTPAYGSFSTSSPAMPAQTRTSNRTQQISYVDPPEPMDYDSYQQPEPTQPPQTFSHPLSLTDDQPFLLAPQQQLQQQPQQLDQLDQPVQPTPARRGRKPKSESGASGVLGGAGVKSKPPVKKMDTGGVEVKTKFPTARIKRIMQADEDVGKVAQVTPVVVAKALELFMIRLITSSATVAKSRGSKKVMSQHMKLAVMQDDQFDNLRDIVGRIPDAPSKAAKDDDGAAGDDADDSGPAAAATNGKAKGRAKGKKRRDSDEL